MAIGNYFTYRGNVNKRVVGTTQQEQNQIANVRRIIASTLGEQESPEKIKKDKNKVALSEVKDRVNGEFQQALNIYSQYIYHNESSKKSKLKDYREMAKYPEISFAVNEYVNEAINYDENGNCLSLKINNKNFEKNDHIRTTLQAEFSNLMYNILNINEYVDKWFREYIIDGEIFFEKVIDKDTPTIGITRVKKLLTQCCYPVFGDIETEEIVFYTYKGIADQDLLQMPKEMISYANSGLSEIAENEQDITIMSLLEMSKVNYRRLKLLEDALVVYRIIRAPERRIFNIDVGNLPKGRAEQYMAETIRNHRQRKFFDPATGDVTEGIDPIAMTEDYYFPMYAGTKGSNVTTLPGGQNLDQIQDVQHFLKKLYRALNIPMSRWGEDKKVQIGAEGDLNYDELTFLKEVKKYTKRFSKCFKDIFITHLKLKGIVEEIGLSNEDIEIEMCSNNLFELFMDSKKMDIKFNIFNNFKELIDTEHKPLSQEFIIKKYLGIDSNDWKENVKLRTVEKEINNREDKEKENADSGGDLGGGGLGDLDDLGSDVNSTPGSDTPTPSSSETELPQ